MTPPIIDFCDDLEKIVPWKLSFFEKTAVWGLALKYASQF